MIAEWVCEHGIYIDIWNLGDWIRRTPVLAYLAAAHHV